MTTKNTVESFDWSKFYSKDVLQSAARATQIKLKSKWLLPQLLAEWAKMPLITTAGVIDCKDTLLQHLEHDATKQAQHRVLVYLNRGEVLEKQTHGDNPHYCTLVPLILSAYKRYHNMPYETWRTAKHLELIVPHLLLEAMQCGEAFSACQDLGSERLLEIRDGGLMYKSGKAEGQMRSVTTTWQLSGVEDPLVSQLPKLAQTMLTQIWCAHPTLRNNYMILDPNNWDVMPEPLIPQELFNTPTTPTKPETCYPWDL